ncbi:MAG: hypothetical protein AAGI52_11635 [Bacteroidota bacterium]
MSGSSRKRRRVSDGDYPAYFTRRSGFSVGWPFLVALGTVLGAALLAAVLMA